MPQDFLTDPAQDYDLAIDDGDFVVGESSEDHVRDWMLATKGENRMWPLLGVGLRNWLLEDASLAELKHIIQITAEYDGCRIERIQFTTQSSNQLRPEIDAYYGS